MTLLLLFIGFYQSLSRLISMIVEGFVQRPLVNANPQTRLFVKKTLRMKPFLSPAAVYVRVCVLYFCNIVQTCILS